MPNASLTHAIVFAVYIPAHEPAEGQAESSKLFNSSILILPASKAPTASYTSCTVTARPFHVPGSIVPPYTKMHGKLSLAIPIIVPGRLLSHPDMPTRPSY